ncbi:hypothetical protein GQA70_02745 [Ponticoccus alexandrii]|uniref:FCD domain-containing protein n=2 Tax=Ponticoccus alexandrii TaxID=1943633 RepID=A0ABX7F4M7_9RHOB|nr:hypothetical protein [Ponticoccus alexandrii]QRF65323.1 hypothetical protein GQA70_02745 [Ponticoccus alexandrii]
MVNLLSDLTVHRNLYEPPNAELWRRGTDDQTRLVMALREGDADAHRRDADRAIVTTHLATV